MPPHPASLFAGIPAELPEELTTILAQGNNIRIERIVSRGHCSPPGFYYEQDEDEWVLLIAGAARLEVDGIHEVTLAVGDYIELPRGLRHRVTWTPPDTDTIWLAIFRPSEQETAAGHCNVHGQ